MKQLYAVIICGLLAIYWPVISNAGTVYTEPEELILYKSLSNNFPKPDYDVFAKALIGYRRLQLQGKLSDKNLLTIIDFRKPSTEKRLWIIDVGKRIVVFHTFVAHGKNSGNVYPEQFSNKMNSHQSSLGFFVTGETYMGRHGLSLKLHGIEKGINDLAEQRAIVIHPADYASEKYIKAVGRLGRSHGCPALSPEVASTVINKIKMKTCLFIYYPDPAYLAMSEFVKYSVNNEVKVIKNQSL